MATPEVELLVGARRDGVVPSLAIGFGGIWTEALEDVVVVPLPVSPERAERAIRSLRAAPLLTGGRGREPLDLAGAAELAARVGDALLEHDLNLLELNPVAVGRDGCVALDAVAQRSGAPARAEAA